MASDRFLTLTDVAEVLNISMSQTYALVRNGELEAIKIGGRGQYRVERDKLESYIARMYDETRKFLAEHPFAEGDSDSDTGSEADSERAPGLT
jgi:excisionase family DNA binding protein